VKPPLEFGLPEKFSKWRINQEAMIDFMQRSDKRVISICAPTGSGKSPAYIAYAMSDDVPTAIVTDSRGLQDQLMADFGSIGLVDLRGRRNYQCGMKPGDPGYTCEEGYAARCPYRGTVQCPCSQAEMRAAGSKLVVTNYAKWTAAKKFGTGWEHIKRVIFDEGHNTYDALSSAMQVVLYHKEIERDLKLDFPKHPEADEFSTWKNWAAVAKSVTEIAMISAQSRITGVGDPKPAWVKHYTHMRNLLRRIVTLSIASPFNWIVEKLEDEAGYQFNPINPGKYTEGALLFRVPKVVVISATLRPKTMYMIGIGKENFDFREFDSDFNPQRCPIYYVPTMRVDHRSPDLSMLWLRLDQILAKRTDRKGIIQTTSFLYQNGVQQSSRFSSKMILNPQGEAPTGVIERFRNSNPGSILVSPSIGQGYDFPGDQCRYTIILKIPFEPPSKIQKAREELDKEYRPYKAMQRLVQQVGRDVRSREDWSERFIIDSNAEWFMPRYGHLAPKSFHALYKEVDVLPQPPSL
jgi:ATP-dependent DNA helicase DinG